MKVVVNGQELDFSLAAEEAINDLNEYKWNGLEAQIEAEKKADFDRKHKETCERLQGSRSNPISTNEIGKLSGSFNTPVQFTKDQETYFEMMRKRLLNPEGKLPFDPNRSESVGSCCDNPDKYKNVISNSMKFYSCRSCGADLGNIDD